MGGLMVIIGVGLLLVAIELSAIGRELEQIRKLLMIISKM